MCVLFIAIYSRLLAFCVATPGCVLDRTETKLFKKRPMPVIISITVATASAKTAASPGFQSSTMHNSEC